MNSTKKLFTDQIDNTARAYLLNREVLPTEEEVKKAYYSFGNAIAATDQYQECRDAAEEIIFELSEQYLRDQTISKKMSFFFCDEDTKPWLRTMERDIDWYYWDRYQKYLSNTKKWAPIVVRSLAKDTEQILDLTADPLGNKSFSRRGLVMASVQSGKTSNYTGLVCRAADAGYKIIIVMAGVHNVLRNQTQIRLEEGFTGFNIDKSSSAPIGCAAYCAQKRRPVCCTSRTRDFNKASADRYRGIQSTQTDDPWFFVVKKNSNTLKQVAEWLKTNCSRDEPLLLIDDEADNASINGKYRKETRDNEVTCINRLIREILHTFNKTSYIGYTATPFANILVDPNTNSKELGRDIFPRNFIYTLEEPSNYFGARKIFEDIDESNQKHLRFIDDIDEVLPPSHKSTECVECIPDSLKQAIDFFVLASAIREVRGEGDEHSTMMINVSPYTYVQKQVAMYVEDYLIEMQHSIKLSFSLPEKEALASSEVIRSIKKVWENDPLVNKCPWDEIQSSLYAAVRKIHVVSINSASQDVLNYENEIEHVIAIGGYRLSRGLTLEGLMVSYYSRNARAYDALMQMARWFGFRPNYEDLCRVWISRTSAEWYSFVSDATEELIDELRLMHQAGKTPKDFGLHIREHPSSLVVTAYNKFGTGRLMRRIPCNLNNSFVETTAFKRNQKDIAKNFDAGNMLIHSIESLPKEDTTTDNPKLFKNVSVDAILSFIGQYINCDVKSPLSKTNYIIDYIYQRNFDGELLKWDVYFPNGKSNRSFHLPNNSTACFETRTPSDDTTHDSIVNTKKRLASRGVEKTGLDQNTITEVERIFLEENPEKKNVPDYCYRKVRVNPLLIIHNIEFGFDEKNQGSIEKYHESFSETWPNKNHKEAVLGWSISFPHTDKHVEPVDYIFNEVALIDFQNEVNEEPSDDDYEDE